MIRFLLPSLVGILMFLTPIPIEGGGANIGIGILTDWTKALLGDALPWIVVAALWISAVLSTYAAALRPAWKDTKDVRRIFAVGGVQIGVRWLAAALGLMVAAQVGPEWITSVDTGGTMLNTLMTAIFVLFLFASVLLPFLTDFGLMEFIGALVRPVFRPLFRLPGRGAVDGAASWFGSSVVGIIITTMQYEDGYYSRREAAVLATTFSVVSVAFAVVVIDTIGLLDYFVPYYGAIFASGMVAAVILPRIPPLSRKRDEYHEGAERQGESLPENQSALSWGLSQAKERAASAPPPAAMARQSLHTTFDIWFALEPLVMVIGTGSLIVATYTPFFTWLSFPFVPFLELLQLPEAATAAPAFIVGFADQFLPVLLGQAVESELTRFVIACTAVTQLIYMSEVGALLLKSKLSLHLGDLFAIFLLRTLITVPICALIGHMIF